MSSDLVDGVRHIRHHQIQVYLLGVALGVEGVFDEHQVGMWRQEQVDLEFSVVVAGVLEHFLDCDLLLMISISISSIMMVSSALED